MRNPFKRKQVAEFVIEKENGSDKDLEYTDLIELVRSGGFPSEILLSPESFHHLRFRFATPGRSGADDQGEFLWVGRTQLRPSYSAVQKQEFLDISETTIRKWLLENRK